MARQYTKMVDLVYANICKRVQIRALLQYSEQTLLDSLYMSHQVKHSDESQQTFRYRMAGLCRFASLPTQMRRDCTMIWWWWTLLCQVPPPGFRPPAKGRSWDGVNIGWYDRSRCAAMPHDHKLESELDCSPPPPPPGLGKAIRRSAGLGDDRADQLERHGDGDRAPNSLASSRPVRLGLFEAGAWGPGVRAGSQSAAAEVNLTSLVTVTARSQWQSRSKPESRSTAPHHDSGAGRGGSGGSWSPHWQFRSSYLLDLALLIQVCLTAWESLLLPQYLPPLAS